MPIAMHAMIQTLSSRSVHERRGSGRDVVESAAEAAEASMQRVGEAAASNGWMAAAGSFSQCGLVLWLWTCAVGALWCLQHSAAGSVCEWCVQSLCWKVWQHAAQPV